MMQKREGEYPLTYHPNAHLTSKRNVAKGLKARTKILEVLTMAEVQNKKENEHTIKAISESVGMSYSSTFHHLQLLTEEKIVKRAGRRPYKWMATGKGQISLDELDLGLRR